MVHLFYRPALSYINTKNYYPMFYLNCLLKPVSNRLGHLTCHNSSWCPAPLKVSSLLATHHLQDPGSWCDVVAALQQIKDPTDNYEDDTEHHNPAQEVISSCCLQKMGNILED